MRIKKVKVTNFGSYKELEFNFESQGLVLIQGATGSGKSTLLDAVFWSLYGLTGKDGNADEIRNWHSNNPTTGEIELDTPSHSGFRVYRTRAGRSGNDLFFCTVENNPIRGKDLGDTQRLLDDILGMDGRSFADACYYNESSATANFFSAKAKDRREVFEHLTDLTFPGTLVERLREGKRQNGEDLEHYRGTLFYRSGALQSSQRQLGSLKIKFVDWTNTQEEKILALEQKANNFETEKERKIQEAEVEAKTWQESNRRSVAQLVGQIAKLKSKLEMAPDYVALIKGLEEGLKCKSCGALDAKTRVQIREYEKEKMEYDTNKSSVTGFEDRLAEQKAISNPCYSKVAAAHALENHYYVQLAQERKAKNPYAGQVTDIEEQIFTTEKELEAAQSQIDKLEHDKSSLETLSDLVIKLRASLLESTVRQIEEKTNEILSNYFDADIRVLFGVSDDVLDCDISVNGYSATFKQLSKGQRQLLRLSFWLATRDARCNQLGQSFNLLMLDECTDGLDVEKKIMAHRLLEQLATEHEIVLVVEHGTEAKEAFTNRYRAEIRNGESELVRE